MEIVAPPPFRSPDYIVRFATESWELAGAAALRRAVFCGEQGIFASDDRDAIDRDAIPIVAISTIAGQPDGVVGVVRIHEPEPGLWWGSRLAVAASHRNAGYIGQALIRLAVCSANARGCHRFLAHVQSQNEPLFQRLHWQTQAQETLHRRPHALMQADLSYYPPVTDGVTGFVTQLRKAA